MQGCVSKDGSPSEDFTEQTNVYLCGAFHFPLLLVPPDVLLSGKYSLDFISLRFQPLE